MTTPTPLALLRVLARLQAARGLAPTLRQLAAEVGPHAAYAGLAVLVRRHYARRVGHWPGRWQVTRLGGMALAGWRPGKPRRLPPANVRLDRRLARRLTCPTCGQRGLEFIPVRRGNLYGGVVRCRCGHDEEA
jgi:hypothetical protein